MHFLPTSPSRIVAAVDVGHGHTKWAVAYLPSGERRYGIFPSLTPQTGDGEGHDVIAVPVNGKIFQIGPESHLCIKGITEPRQHHDNYSVSDGNYALNLGSWAQIKESRFDLLVEGLPLSTIASHKSTLLAKLTGDHRVPTREGGSFNVHVARVLVLSQPAGALIAAVKANPKLAKTNKLVIDMGFRTLDALTTVGMSPQREMSCVIKGGQQGALQELNRLIAEQYRSDHPHILKRLDVPPNVYERLLRSEDPVLRPGVGEYPLEKYWHVARERVFGEYLGQLASSVEGAVIENVILAGGGAASLEPYFRNEFPHLSSVLKPERPQFAVVEGYLEYGLQQLSRLP